MGKGGSHLNNSSNASGRNGGRRASEPSRPVRRTTAENRAPVQQPTPKAAPQQPTSSANSSFEDIERRLAEEQMQRQPARRPTETTSRRSSAEVSHRREQRPSESSRSRSRQAAAPKREQSARRPAKTEKAPPRRPISETEQPPRRRPEASAEVHVKPEAERHAPAPRKRSGGRRKKGGIGLWILIGVIAAVMIFSLFKLGKAIFGYAGDRATDSALQETAIKPKLPTATAEADETDEEAVVSEVPFEVDWQALQDANSDIVGWLYCPTIQSINYPVVQTANNEDYLYQDFNGKENSGGTLFADYNSVVGLQASHLIIYGHNMKDESKFGKLKKYLTEEFYEENPIFYFMTPDQDYRVELLDCQTIDASLENYPTYFSDAGTSLNEYIARLTANAYWVNQEADYEHNQLITMSTCTSSDDERLILQGVLVPIE